MQFGDNETGRRIMRITGPAKIQWPRAGLGVQRGSAIHLFQIDNAPLIGLTITLCSSNTKFSEGVHHATAKGHRTEQNKVKNNIVYGELRD